MEHSAGIEGVDLLGDNLYVITQFKIQFTSKIFCCIRKFALILYKMQLWCYLRPM